MKINITSFLYIIIFCLIAPCTSKAFAHAGDDVTKGQLSGKVVDSVTNVPVSYATVSIFKQGSTSPFNGVVTADDGSFAVNNLALAITG